MPRPIHLEGSLLLPCVRLYVTVRHVPSALNFSEGQYGYPMSRCVESNENRRSLEAGRGPEQSMY